LLTNTKAQSLGKLVSFLVGHVAKEIQVFVVVTSAKEFLVWIVVISVGFSGVSKYSSVQQNTY
jgi:hypothetical protein